MAKTMRNRLMQPCASSDICYGITPHEYRRPSSSVVERRHRLIGFGKLDVTGSIPVRSIEVKAAKPHS
jgi:hypothetical protein